MIIVWIFGQLFLVLESIFLMNTSIANKLLFFCLFITNTFVFSQTTIKGKIDFGNNEATNSVSVLLKQGDKTIDYTISTADHTYHLETDKYGSFTLVFSSLNFETKSIEIEILAHTKEIEKNVTLLYHPIALNEVLIESEKPIKVKKDTIVFNAKSFLQGNEQVVEDLLKKIPGLAITSDGTVKVGNQEVEKVMIDGDDFFEKGYKLVTKNMPVNPIDKIEIYQNYSNNKLLKGIENSDKVALNLTLKEDYKRQWFGNATLGYGLVSENRYEVRSNLMNFGKKSKYYFLTHLNNVGNNAVGDINHLIRPYRSGEPGSIGDNQTVNTLLGLHSNLPNLKPKRVNFNNAEILSLNSIFTISKKIKLKAIGFVTTDENDFFRNSFQSFSVGTTTFQNTEDFAGKKTQITGLGKIDLLYDISKNKTLEYIGKFNTTHEKNRSNLVFNTDLLNERLNSDNQLFDQKIVLTTKYNDNKVFLLSGRYIQEKTPQHYWVNQFIFDDLFTENANNTRQYSENQMQFAGVEAHLLNRTNHEDLWEMKIGNQFRADNLNTRFELLENDNSLTFPSGYQNELTYISNDLYLSTKYHFKFGDFTVLTQSDFHQIFNQINNFSTKSHKHPFFIVPSISLDWKINEMNTILASYSYNVTNAGIQDVYSGYVQTGFRSFSKGIGAFNQINASNAVLNYNYGSWGDRFFANTFIMYSKNYDFFSTNSIISQNYSQTEKIMMNDRELISISSSFDRYFKPVKSNLKITLGIAKSNFKNSVNTTIPREVKISQGDYGFELRSSFKGVFNYHFGSKWNYNQIQTTNKNSFTDNTLFLDFSFVMSKKINLQIQTERYLFGNIEKENNKYYFLDLEGRYVIKENKLTFSCSGNNLFNTATFRNYSISDINISKTSYRLQPRYVLLKMEYRF